MDRLASARMFLAVMETGSFTAAARRFGTTSGQASKLVARLEAELGVRLLNRTTRAVSATEIGRAYHDQLHAIVEDFDALDQSVRDASATPRGRVRLTAPLTFGTTELAPALNAFAAAYPEISLDVSFTDRLVNLVDEGFDAAVRVGRPGDSTLIARRLCATRLVLSGADSYLARKGTPGQPGDLAGHDCIIDTNFRDPSHWRFRAEGTPVAVPVQGRLRYSNAEACLRAAEAGLGLALVPDFVAAPALAAGRVRALLTDCGDEPLGVFALYPPGRHLAARVRVLIDHLAGHFRHSRWGA
ncbi:MAG: LysR family transcriptional regulator [Albidovulum sp.]|jgi:DNA-binding transcriptional LysR family regulator|uniref:LysR family transcriptional regulator n=1 Tax=Albidovulum sp. TaxID=1872424 RepID=UPI00302A06FA